MLRNIFLNYLILLFTLRSQQHVPVHAHESIKQTTERIVTTTNSAMQEIVIKDYCSAFEMLTNTTFILSKIIPEMYNISYEPISTSFTFKLPIDDNKINKKHSYQMLVMERSDFLDPIFPNLTTRSHWLHNKLPKATATNSEWSVLGLNGWMGELTKPSSDLEHLHKLDDAFKYPKESIEAALLRGNVDGNINDISSLVGLQRTEDVMSMEDVYIARANDPFGFSTKWQTRHNNKSLDSQVEEQRAKRDVIKLYSMIKCATSCEPIIYKGYGCYCGFLGTGRAVDGLDRCCKIHDKCYEHSNCISFLQYFVPYIWKCYRGKPLCAIDHGEWGGPKSCAARLCNCDLRLARCLKQFTCPQKRVMCTSSVARRFQNLIYFL